VSRNLTYMIEPFPFILTLALIKAFPQKEVVIDGLLKPIITGVYDSELKWKQHYWVAKSLNDPEKNLSINLLKPSKNRLLSTETIMPGFILFLFDILDTYGVRLMKTSKAITLNEHLTMYASLMIRDLFRVSNIIFHQLLY
jgi:hypothetical protein